MYHCATWINFYFMFFIYHALSLFFLPSVINFSSFPFISSLHFKVMYFISILNPPAEKTKKLEKILIFFSEAL